MAFRKVATTWTGTPSASIGPLYIGTAGQSVNNDFTGNVDDLRVYTRALTATQVTALYNEGEVVQKEAPRAGLMGEWLFNEGTSTIAHDTSGNGNNGTLSGSTFPVWTNGKHGKALSFNGTSWYVTGQEQTFRISELQRTSPSLRGLIHRVCPAQKQYLIRGKAATVSIMEWYW